MTTLRTALVVMACLAGHAFAQSGTPGQQAFERGRERLKVGKYAEACEAFEESQRLEPQTATELNIALCSEQIGKLGTALRIHRELAHREDNPQRKISIDLVAALEPRAPRLKIDVSEGGQRARLPSGLVVLVNGRKTTNFHETPGDLGVNQVVATAPGFKRTISDVTVSKEGKSAVVTVILEPLPPGAPEETEADALPSGPAVEPHSTSSRTPLAMILVGTGSATLVGGLVFGALARGKWNDAQDACGGGTACATPEDLARGNELRDAARLRGNVSTALCIVGAAVIGGGLVYWLTAPSTEGAVAVAPSTDGESVNLSFLGRF